MIEVLIVALLGAVVLLGLTTLYIHGLEFYDEGIGRLELQRQGSLAMEDMAREIRGGTSFTIPSQDRLDITVNLAGGGTGTLTYFRDGATSSLRFRNVGCATEGCTFTLLPSTFLPCNVSGLRFIHLDIDGDGNDDNVVRIELELTDNGGQRADFRTTVLLRS